MPNIHHIRRSLLYAPAVVVAGSWPALPVTSGLIGRYIATTGVSLSGSDVTAWADQSGNGHNLSPSGAGTVAYSATGFNSLPGIVFTASEATCLVCDPFAMGTGSVLTVVFAGTMTSSAGAFAGGITYGEGAGSDFNGSGNVAAVVRDDTNESIASQNASLGAINQAITYSTPFWAAIRYGSSGGIGDRSWWLNGTEGTPAGTDDTALTDGGTLVIGERYLTGSPGTSNTWDGAFGEILIYAAELSDADIGTNLAGYFADANGWGL